MVALKVVDLAKWRLVFSSHFSKMEGKTLQNGGFFLEKLSNQCCNMIKDYNKFCKYAKKGHVHFGLRNLKMARQTLIVLPELCGHGLFSNLERLLPL